MYWHLRRASRAVARFESRVRTDNRIWPMLTRATEPLGLPQAPRIPVCNLSAPAHDNILLIRMTWKGWALVMLATHNHQLVRRVVYRILKWKPSFPAILTRYLFAQIRAASRACIVEVSAETNVRRRLRETNLRGQLLVLVGNQVDAQREIVNAGALASKIKDLDFGIGDTTVEPRLGVRLVYCTR